MIKRLWQRRQFFHREADRFHLLQKSIDADGDRN